MHKLKIENYVCRGGGGGGGVFDIKENTGVKGTKRLIMFFFGIIKSFKALVKKYQLQ